MSALEYATGVEAKVVGKPQATFFHQALQQVGVALEEAVMIGDVSEAFCMSSVKMDLFS